MFFLCAHRKGTRKGLFTCIIFFAVGTIPDLSDLTELSKLWLSANKLDGTIPSALSKLHKLNVLYLFENELGECIYCLWEGGKGCTSCGGRMKMESNVYF